MKKPQPYGQGNSNYPQNTRYQQLVRSQQQMNRRSANYPVNPSYGEYLKAIYRR